jgi:hypothetical protein
MSAIPKRLGHIWIGPKPAPVQWMQTWPEKHPGWEYTVYDNDFLVGFPFRLRKQINEYFWRGLYAGVQDMMRYEILYHFGGFMADADAICLHPVDELLDKPRAYTVYDRPETDKFRGVCPFLACEPGNPLIGRIIDAIAETPPEALRKAEVSTGNRFLMSRIRKWQPDEDQLKIWPTHYFVPWQKSDPSAYYDGPDKVYAEQKWATSMYAYNRADGPGEEVLSGAELDACRNAVLDRLAGGMGRRIAPQRGLDGARTLAASEQEGHADRLLDAGFFKADFESLGAAVLSALEGRDVAGQPVHGLHFYRHMQNAPISTSKLKSYSRRIRGRLVGWLAGAQDALVVGFDTGHLPATALGLNEALRVTAIDCAKWDAPKAKDRPATQLYVPKAAAWLNARFSGRCEAHVADEVSALRKLANDNQNLGRFDLLMMPKLGHRSLAVLKAAQPLLAPEAVVICASTDHTAAAAHLARFRLQGLAYQPFELESHGARAGSILGFRIAGPARGS